MTVPTIVENGKTIVKERGVSACHKMKDGYAVLAQQNTSLLTSNKHPFV
jgi:hypothetical protein